MRPISLAGPELLDNQDDIFEVPPKTVGTATSAWPPTQRGPARRPIAPPAPDFAAIAQGAAAGSAKGGASAPPREAPEGAPAPPASPAAPPFAPPPPANEAAPEAPEPAPASASPRSRVLAVVGAVMIGGAVAGLAALAIRGRS